MSGNYNFNVNYVNNTQGIERVQISNSTNESQGIKIEIGFKGRQVTHEIAERACQKTIKNLSGLVREYFKGSMDDYFAPKDPKHVSKARIVDWKIRHQNDNPIAKLFRYIVFRIKNKSDEPRVSDKVTTNFTPPKSSPAVEKIDPVVPAIPSNDPESEDPLANSVSSASSAPSESPQITDNDSEEEILPFHDGSETGSMVIHDDDNFANRGSVVIHEESRGSVVIIDETDSRGSMVMHTLSWNEPNNTALFLRKPTGVSHLEDVWTPCNLEEADRKGIERMKNEGRLLGMIAERKQEIEDITDRFKKQVEEKNANNPDSAALKKCVQKGWIRPVEGGCGGTYLVYEKQNLNDQEIEVPRWFIKPLGEDAFCINNNKKKATPWNDQEILHRVRSCIPLYATPQNEAAARRLAEEAGIPSATPVTFLDIVACDAFHDILDGFREELEASANPDDQQLLKIAGQGLPKVKLCSVQRYEENEGTLSKFYDPTLKEPRYVEEFWKAFDASSLEDVLLLLWLTGDNDGNIDNFLCQKGKNGLNRIIKIDNGLILPTQNQSRAGRVEYLNALARHPAMQNLLSSRMKEIISKLNIEKLKAIAIEFNREDGVNALRERVQVLQALAKKTDITLSEIEMRMAILSTPQNQTNKLPAGMTAFSTAVSPVPLIHIQEIYGVIVEGNFELLFPNHWEKGNPDIAALGLFEMTTLLQNLRKHEQSSVYQMQKLVKRLQQLYPEDYQKINEAMQNRNLEVCEGGTGGTFFVCDKQGKRTHVLKYYGTGMGEYRNNKGEATPWLDGQFFHRVKRAIPLYRSHIAAYLSSETAKILGMPEITPRTWISIEDSSGCKDILDKEFFSKDSAKSEREKQDLQDYVAEYIGKQPTETIVSVQEYIQEEQLQEFVQLQAAWQKEIIENHPDELQFTYQEYKELQDKHPKTPNETKTFESYQSRLLPMYLKKLSEAFAEEDDPEAVKLYAKIQLQLWLTGAADFHTSNLMVFKKKETGKWGLKIVDQDLTFPDENADFRNEITHWPQSQKELPDFIKEKIMHLSVNDLREVYKNALLRAPSARIKRETLISKNPLLDLALTMAHSHIGPKAFEAMLERIKLLQKIIKNYPHATMEEVNIRMKLLGMRDEFEALASKKVPAQLKHFVDNYQTVKKLARSNLSFAELQGFSELNIDPAEIDRVRNSRL